MKQLLKKFILSSSFFSSIAVFYNKLLLKRKHGLRYGKNVFIGFSVVFEGKNSFARNSSITGSEIGYASYISANSAIAKTKIGRYSSIGPNVQCIFGKHPAHTFVSTHPSFFSVNSVVGFSYTKVQKFKEFADIKDSEGKYSIIIGHDVWIGANVSIMDGVEIGDGAIVAANSLVNKDVPPFTIVGGVPAKTIKKRFSEEQIEFLKQLQWWNKPEEWIRTNASDFVDIEEFHKKHMHAN